MTHEEGMLKERQTFKDGQDNLKKTFGDLFSACPAIGLDRQRRSGVPTVGSTRFPFAQLLAELADTERPRNLVEICKDFDLDLDAAKNSLEQLAVVFDSKYL